MCGRLTTAGGFGGEMCDEMRCAWGAGENRGCGRCGLVGYVRGPVPATIGAWCGRERIVQVWIAVVVEDGG